LATGGFTLVYFLVDLVRAYAWWVLLGWLGATVPRRWALRTYGVSEIAKYVPGNIFHLVGRQAMGMATGVSAWPMAKSLVYELGLVAATGALFGFLAFPLVVPGMHAILGLVAFVFVVGSTAALLWRYVSACVTGVFCLYVICLAVSAAIFVGLLALVSSNSLVVGWLIFQWGGAYVLAWLAGLLTPGAPAGLGIREVVLLFLLGRKVPEADLLLAIVLGRGVNLLGDVIFFAVSVMIRPPRGGIK
jgi:hypothetical protein